MPDIFSYGDYRKFLADSYSERKCADPGFSFQHLARLCGFGTKTFLFKVIRGEKALSGPSIQKVASGLSLNKSESRYFKALIGFNEGGTVEQREQSFLLLRAFKYTNRQVRLRTDQYDYFAKWYHVVLRELVTIIDFKEDFNLLARSVIPAIRPQQARSGVTFLLEMGFIEKKSSGRYCQTSKNLTTGDEVISTAVQRFQKETMSLGSQAIDRFPREMRDISTLTLGLSQEGFESMKCDLQNYRKHLVGVAEKDSNPKQVFQLNFQFFPVSALPKTRNPRKRGS